MPSADKTPNALPSAASPKPRVSARRSAPERRFELGLFYYHRGDYARSLKEFEKACETASQLADYPRFVESCTYVLRLLAEREEFSKIDRIEASVLEILKVAQIEVRLKSRAMYALGICSCYQDSKHELAVRRFRDAIDFAVLSEDKEALAGPLYGAAAIHYARHKYDDAIRELDRLSVLLSCLRLPDIASASHLLRAMVLRNQGHLEESLAAAWVAFDSLKHHPHLVLYLHTLCVLGSVYRLKGDPGSARLYLDLANRGLKRDEFPRIARLVDEAMESLGSACPVPLADLAFDTRTGILMERVKGEIRFEGQFILRDLLRAFLEKPGQVFTKEELVKQVWKEDYDPKTHDNKIYVTIKRLRKLLEPETDKADYILRAKNGYFLNPKTRVLIDDQSIAPVATGEIAGSLQ